MSSDLNQYAQQLARAARRAAGELVAVSIGVKSAALHRFANALRDHSPQILLANARDVAAAQSARYAEALIERLKLDPARIEAMADGVDQVAVFGHDPDGRGECKGVNRPA